MRYLADEYWEKFTKEVTLNNKRKTIQDGIEFEKLVRELLFLKFQGEWKGTKMSHDNNRDFFLYSEQERIWAECKNYKDSIAMSTIAPTLVMAQIFDIDRIIFFSYSPINDNAKRKIFSFGRKVNKKIQIYDDCKLEELIIDVGNLLPNCYRPIFRTGNKEFVDNEIDIRLFVRMEPSLATDDEMSDFVPYKDASKIFYNKLFALYFFFTNTSAVKSYKLKIRIKQERSPDLLFFQYLDGEFNEPGCFSYEISIDNAEGTVIQSLLKPIIYKHQLSLPVFEVEVLENEKVLYRWQNEPVIMDCTWVGQTKLIGSQYENSIRIIDERVLLRDKIGITAVYGESGTGKTRLLTELMDKLLKRRYRVLNFIGAENDDSMNIIKEIIYFLYEIPKSEITEYLEMRLFSRDGIQRHYSPVKGVQLLNMIFRAPNLSELEVYYDIIFEKISHMRIAIIFDNIQYFSNTLIDFISKYIKYAQNQCYSNHSVILCTFNIDFITNASLELLNNIRILENALDSVYTTHLTGFHDEGQSILFLRELVHSNTEENDLLFSQIINKVTSKPYYLHQAIKYLEEENTIFHAPAQQGFLIDNEKFHDAVHKMPKGINDLLKSRYRKLLESNDENSLLLILSTTFLFGKINSSLADILSLDGKIIDNLLLKAFLTQKSDQSLEFDHDIIRTFLSREILGLEKYAIHYILEHKLTEEFSVYPFVYCFLLLNNKRMGKNQYLTIRRMVSIISVPLYLCDSFYFDLFKITLRKETYFKDFGQWFPFAYDICKIIRDRLGSSKALDYYQPLYDNLLLKEDKCFKNISIFYAFMMSYTDLLSHLKKNDKAISVLKHELYESNRYRKESGDNHVLTFEAIVCNRLHVNYKDHSDSESQENQQYYLDLSEKITPNIVLDSERKLLEYLNLSDKGYCYYCLQEDKEQLLEIWNQCLRYPPDVLPEKTMNYYRKCVQLDLISQDTEKVFEHSKQALEYLESGKYAHEHLVFKHFFQVAKCIAYLIEGPEKNKIALDKGIHLAAELQKILNNAKMKDIYVLRAVHGFYKNKPDEVFLNFREAYNQYERIKLMTNYTKKRGLLLDNIIYAFYKMHIWDNGLYNCSFVTENIEIKSFLKMDSTEKENYIFQYEARGIIRTSDLYFNLPTI